MLAQHSRQNLKNRVPEEKIKVRHLPGNKIPAVFNGNGLVSRDLGLTAGILFLWSPLRLVSSFVVILKKTLFLTLVQDISEGTFGLYEHSI
ncbi:hypothetical protein DP117_05230 [Brasilonema sp. UFV-L1]|nr:hypothetical protein [Brasilonema sp. UFV-L1]